MTGDDELLRSLRDVDPARPGGPADPQQGPTAHDILERAMQIADRHDTVPTTDERTRGSRWPVAVAVAAAAVVAVGGGFALSGVLTSGESDAPATTLALTATAPDAASMCMVFDPAMLTNFPTALAGTVTAVEGDTATVEVDRWYRGGPADVVTVTSTAGGAALDGVDLTVGGDYLLTAGDDGVVSSCGYSGPASPELQQAFDQAYGG